MKRTDDLVGNDCTYSEDVSFPLINIIYGGFLLIAALFLALLLYQLIVEPIGTDPAPTWYYAMMFGVFLFVCFFMLNFRKQIIRITPDQITIAFGIIKRTIPWQEVERSYLDKPSIVKYGGYGLRITRIGGLWRLAWVIWGRSHIVLRLHRGRFREIVFSTAEPEKVQAITERCIQRSIYMHGRRV